MMRMIDEIQLVLTRELASFRKEVEMFPDDTMLWRTAPGISNSAGNLALHVCGNLKHYIGHVLGGTDYVRDRDAEFKTRSGRRRDLVREIDETIDVVSRTLPQLSEAVMAGVYPEKVLGMTLPCSRFLVHLSCHTAFHLGQAGYLRRILTGENQSSDGLALRALLTND
jgi:hypothetical protein